MDSIESGKIAMWGADGIVYVDPPQNVLVPLEPTQAMIDAVRASCVGGANPPSEKTIRKRWAAMLAASPYA